MGDGICIPLGDRDADLPCLAATRPWQGSLKSSASSSPANRPSAANPWILLSACSNRLGRAFNLIGTVIVSHVTEVVL